MIVKTLTLHAPFALSSLRAFLDIAAVWCRAFGERRGAHRRMSAVAELAKLDAAALRDLGICSSELMAYEAEASGLTQRTYRRSARRDAP